MKKIICTILIAMAMFFAGCADKQSNLNSDNMKILNKSYSQFSPDDEASFIKIQDKMNKHDWETYGDKVKKIYIEQNTKNGNGIGEELYKSAKEKAIRKLEGKETEEDKKEATNTATIDTKVTLTDSSIKLTTDTLKRDTLVKEVAITMPDNNGTINIAIQVNAATNKNKAKDLIDTTVRQLGSNSGGKALTKTYLGSIWENYSGHIRIFSGEKDIILDGYITKGSNNITY